jgi:two-component system, cell cycle response regulator
MTGLYNRRYFDNALNHELLRCQRYGRCFSLLMVDVDQFKRINDTYGHDAGDKAIRQVADLLRKNLRGLDVVARLGGEEYAVLMPETPPQSIHIVAERVLKEIGGAVPAIPEMAQRQERITVSIGLATYRGGDVTPLSIIKMADASLYQAKRGGRNRCGPLQEYVRFNRRKGGPGPLPASLPQRHPPVG